MYDNEEGITKLSIDFTTHKVKVYDSGGNVINEEILPAEVVARFLAIDPLSEKYYPVSAYAYVANNPILLIDPDGREIVNAYEDYKQYTGLESQLRKDIDEAKTKSERRAARKELKANNDKIAGFNKYQEVQTLIGEFQQANQGEFNRVNSLSLNGVEINVVVNLADRKGDIGQLGDTKYDYGRDPNKYMRVTNQSGKSHLVPMQVSDNEIDVTLYSDGRTLSTLANEFGDAIFAVENPKESYYDASNKTPYDRRATTQFSFDYQRYIIKGDTKPNPLSY